MHAHQEHIKCACLLAIFSANIIQLKCNGQAIANKYLFYSESNLKDADLFCHSLVIVQIFKVFRLNLNSWKIEYVYWLGIFTCFLKDIRQRKS